jgi:hypothetical protein
MVSEPEQFIVSFFGCLLAASTPPTVMPRGLFGKADGSLDHISGILAAANNLPAWPWLLRATARCGGPGPA